MDFICEELPEQEFYFVGRLQPLKQGEPRDQEEYDYKYYLFWRYQEHDGTWKYAPVEPGCGCCMPTEGVNYRVISWAPVDLED